jgi:hypothetical protein
MKKSKGLGELGKLIAAVFIAMMTFQMLKINNNPNDISALGLWGALIGVSAYAVYCLVTRSRPRWGRSVLSGVFCGVLLPVLLYLASGAQHGLALVGSIAIESGDGWAHSILAGTVYPLLYSAVTGIPVLGRAKVLDSNGSRNEPEIAAPVAEQNDA